VIAEEAASLPDVILDGSHRSTKTARQLRGFQAALSNKTPPIWSSSSISCSRRAHLQRWLVERKQRL
jgi:hypothetical protein